MSIEANLLLAYIETKVAQFLTLFSLKVVLLRLGDRYTKGVKWLLTLMHIVYLVFLILAFVLHFSTRQCAGSSKGLAVYSIKDGIYVICFIILLILHCKNYFIAPSDQPHEDKFFKYQTSRLMCYATWCMFVAMMSLVAWMSLMDSTIGCSPETNNEWAYSDCEKGLVIDALKKFVILNSAALPCIVFFRTPYEVEGDPKTNEAEMTE